MTIVTALITSLVTIGIKANSITENVNYSRNNLNIQTVDQGL